MSVTQEQHQQVLGLITDLRVELAKLSGDIKVTNERINSTNNALGDTNIALNSLARAVQENARQGKRTFYAVLGVIATIVAAILPFLLHI